MKQSSDFTVAQFASTSDRHVFDSFASTDTLTDRKSMTQRSNYPAQTPQILNDWAPRAKNSCESTTSPLISQLSGSQILNYKPPRYFFYLLSLFASVIIHQGHERKQINLCLAAFIDPPLKNLDHFPRETFTTILRTDGFEAQLTLP